MNEMKARSLIAVMVLLTGLNVTVVAFIGGGIVLVMADMVSQWPVLFLAAGYAVMAQVLATFAVGLNHSGYARAFWQLLGYDLSPDEPGETA